MELIVIELNLEGVLTNVVEGSRLHEAKPFLRWVDAVG